MKKLVRWLREVEHLAYEVYFQAATVYADDPQFKSFLEQIAEEEAWHYGRRGQGVRPISDAC